MQVLLLIDKYFIKLRFENSFYFFQKKLTNYFTNYFLSIYWFERFYVLEHSTFIKKSSISLIKNNLFFTQKSFKYLFSTPVNGQRTWSNAQTSKKLNVFLINFKIQQFKEIIIGKVNINNLKHLIFINYFNWIWKMFWRKDWIFLYKRNKSIFKKIKYSKKQPLTLYKLLNYRAPNKRQKIKTSIDLKNYFNYIGLDSLINLKKKN